MWMANPSSSPRTGKRPMPRAWPVYLDGDAMYFTHQESEQITRLDGKQMLFL